MQGIEESINKKLLFGFYSCNKKGDSIAESPSIHKVNQPCKTARVSEL